MLIKEIHDSFAAADLTSDVGRFLSDKCYAYDAVYFMAKFIKKNLDSSSSFDYFGLKNEINSYTADIFQLKHDSSVLPNYMHEVINLLCFARVMAPITHGIYAVLNIELLNFILERIENSYVFMYLLVHRTLQNHGLLDVYKTILNAGSGLNEDAINSFFLKFSKLSISIGDRGTNTNWAKMLVKYPLNVLGYVNNSVYITRTLHVRSRLVTIQDVSINVNGTRTPAHLPKKNDYIVKFDKNYTLSLIKDYLFIDVTPRIQITNKIDSVADSLANLKLDILFCVNHKSVKSLDIYEQDQYVDTMIRARNGKIQRIFRESLFKECPQECAICGFNFQDFLIASHILPYSKCEDTYDAVNPYNGLLLCPLHDRLFEGGKHMTIRFDNGEIILSKDAKSHKDFQSLEGNKVSKSLFLCERKHYLKKHNDLFSSINL